MSAGRRILMRKESTSATFNIKEKRCLEKSIQMLDLEKSYAVKLLDLEHKSIRVNYKRLKDRVSKIKSHLSAEEITVLKRLEYDGKIKPYYNPVNLTGALQIAAASKRLNFPQPPNRSRSNVSYTNTRFRMGAEPATSSRPSTVLSNFRRSNSVNDCIDAHESDMTQQHSIATSSIIRPRTAFASSTHFQSNKNIESRRPATVGNVKTATTSARSSRPISTHALYSSHSAVEKEARWSKMHQLPKRPKDSRMSFLSDDSIDSNFGDDIQDERRQVLLLDEMEKMVELEEKKNDFLTNLTKYLRNNPQRQWNLPDGGQMAVGVSPNPESRANSATTSGTHKRRLFQQRVDFDITNEENYKQRNLQLWKDMNKCRYLRVPDDMIDVSGVVTLVSSQMKMFQVLNQQENDSCLTSAEA